MRMKVKHLLDFRRLVKRQFVELMIPQFADLRFGIGWFADLRSKTRWFGEIR